MHVRRLFSVLLFVTVLFIHTLSVCAFEDGQIVRLSNAGFTLSVENSSLDQGKPVLLWTETNTNSQRWLLTETGRGTFFMQNVYSEFYLGGLSSTTSGSQVGQIARAVAQSRGQWELVPLEGKEGKYIVYYSTTRRYALGTGASSAEGGTITFVNVQTVDSARFVWDIEVTEPIENRLTKAIRDDMVEKWKAHYYHKASTGYVIGKGGWWGDAEMFEIVLDALETTGKKEYAEMFHNLYLNFCQRNRTDWSYNEYNDDIAWMCIACVRAYLLTGNAEYRTRAKENFDKMYARANVYGNGTLVWKQGNKGTNSCINGPAAVCACYLGIALNQESYFKKAAKIYEGQRAWLFNINSSGVFNGHVYDSYSTTENKVSNTWASTYNQGTSMGAAIMLYNHYGTEQYKTDADAIMKWTSQNLANSHGIIKVCQTVTGDLTGFKGILMRYIRKYASDLNHPEYYEWLAKNAYHAWNNRNSKGISMSAWLYKTTEDFNYSDGGNFDTDGVGAFTAISAAFNAHLGVKDVHKAYERMEAEDFNFIRGGNVVEGTDEEDTSEMYGQMRNGNYVGFRNVDFDDRAASHMTIRAMANRAIAKLNVYADQPSAIKGKLLCSISAEELGGSNKWMTIEKELELPISGIHDIYIVAGGATNVDLMNVNWFQFDSKNTIYGDITNNTGKLSSNTSVTDNDVLMLVDDDVTTDVTFEREDSPDDQLIIRYDSPAPVLIQGYSIFSGLTKSNHPNTWTLQASMDGEVWVDLHVHNDTVFSVCAERMKYDLETSQEYSIFRLVIPFSESQEAISLSEWQLLGRSISQTDITSDGGKVSEGAEMLVDHVGNTSVLMPESVVYQSKGDFLLTAYSLTIGEQYASASWILEGSTNGTSWTVIDSREDVSFPYPSSTVTYALQTEKSYEYFRLRVLTENSSLQQWQLFGNRYFGDYYADVTALSKFVSCDGSSVEELSDDDGNTFVTVEGDSLYWMMESLIEVKPVAFSVVCGDDVAIDPSSIILRGWDKDGNVTVLSTRSVTFDKRGERITATVSTSKIFSKFQIQVIPAEGKSKVRLADFELYGAVIASVESEFLPFVGSVTASIEGLSSTENVEKLNDQNRTSRYRANFSAPCMIFFQYDSPVLIDTYALTAARDNSSCDPKSWTLEASNDGENWTLIDNREGEKFSHRYATQFYPVQLNDAYSQYRLTVTEVNGGTQIQIGELQLLNLSNGTGIVSPSESMQEVSIIARGGKIQVHVSSVATICVYDMQGRMYQSISVPAGYNTLSAPKTDVYIVVVDVEGKKIVRKILK